MFKSRKSSFLLSLLCSLTLLGLLACGGDNTVGPGPPPEPNPEPTPEPVPNHASGDLVIDLPGGVKMAFMWIEPGTFMMGTPDSVQINFTDSERPQHQVTLTKGFYLSKYELTQQQWQQVMGTAPWSGQVDSIGPDFPASYFNWDDAQAYVEKLTTLQNDAIYRLPTEAEWEYACRAGTTTRWSFGSDSEQIGNYAWWRGNVNGPQKVGYKLPNPWGLYDMHGNVYEWVQDWFGFGPYPSEPQIDPTGPPKSPHPVGNIPSRSIRGGDYDSDSIHTRSASRIYFYYRGEAPWIGLRILREGLRISQQ